MTPAETIATPVATQNACKLCAPLGASLAFRGIQGTATILHGSQGCATYIRRYLIGHFREPVDIASSSFDESSTVFGGGENLLRALENVAEKYHPELIGVASTCLSETMGEDLTMLARPYKGGEEGRPRVVTVSTPSYRDTHAEGFHATVRAVVAALAEPGETEPDRVNIFPGMVSPADLRYLAEMARGYGLRPTIAPDYSDTLDGPALAEYAPVPQGGTPLDALRSAPRAALSITPAPLGARAGSAGLDLQNRFQVPHTSMPTPIGVEASDRLAALLGEVLGKPMPEEMARERGCLIDTYVDAHKYLFGARAVVYGEEDLVAALAGFLSEIGVVPVLCASGGRSGKLEAAVRERTGDRDDVTPMGDSDFADIADKAEALKPDLLIGNSKGYPIARRLGVPLVRVGMPVHDRMGAQRILSVGYRGTQSLLDRVANALLAHRQDASPVGYANL